MMTFNEEKHLYTWNGEPIPSVSQVIKSVCGSSYDSIPADVLAKASYRGTAVHTASELVDGGVCATEYIQSVKSHSETVFGEQIDITLPVEAYARLDRPKWDLVEHRFYCAGEFPFAGTIDRVKDGVPYEIKCNATAKKDSYALQLSFYAKALGSDKIGDVYHVTKEGKGNIISGLAPRFADVDAILRVFYMVHHKQWLKEAKEKMK